MSPIRERAKEILPTALLTLLSIVQALSLELWWQYVSEQQLPSFNDIDAITHWAQIVATLMAIVIVWVVYASTAMRFKWVPTTFDSIAPFAIGLIQFISIETLYSDQRGGWLIAMAGVLFFALFILQTTMRRARFDPDNEAFFSNVEPATLSDFVPNMVAIAVLVLSGLLTLFYDWVLLCLIVTLAVLVLLTYQLILTNRFWHRSMHAEP